MPVAARFLEPKLIEWPPQLPGGHSLFIGDSARLFSARTRIAALRAPLAQSGYSVAFTQGQQDATAIWLRLRFGAAFCDVDLVQGVAWGDRELLIRVEKEQVHLIRPERLDAAFAQARQSLPEHVIVTHWNRFWRRTLRGFSGSSTESDNLLTITLSNLGKAEYIGPSPRKWLFAAVAHAESERLLSLWAK